MNLRMRIGLGFVAGALAGGGVAAALAMDDPSAAPDRPPLTTLAAVERIVEAPWVEGGVRFRSTVLVPRSFVVGEGHAELEYELVPLHWAPAVAEGDPVPIAVRPERWELISHAGAVIEAATDVEATRVRFDVPSATEAEDVARVQVVAWRVAAPQGATVILPLESGAQRRFSDGTTIEVTAVLAQSSSTILQLEAHGLEDSFVGHAITPFTALHPDWRISGRSGSGVQLTWEGPDAPDEIELTQAYPAWLTIETTTLVLGEADE